MLESVVKQACPVFLEETICLVYSDTVINWLIFSMEQSPSWEANKSAASQDITHILSKPEVYCHIHILSYVRKFNAYWDNCVLILMHVDASLVKLI
jgi:hypothetical protein